MINVSNAFKQAIAKNGREIDCEIKKGTTTMTNEDIFKANLYSNGALLKTMMKKLEFEVKNDLDISDRITYKAGIKVNGSFEYINYGWFTINEKEYKEDTKTYVYKAYDDMLKTMVNYYPVTQNYPTTLYQFTYDLLYELGFTLNNQTLPNGTRQLQSDPFEGYERLTFRDVLDYICEVVGGSGIVSGANFIFLTPNDTNETITADYLKDTNVNFGETFGPINSILFTRFEDSDYVEIKDDSSISQYGKTQIKIKNNPILNNDDRVDYQSELFAVLNGLSYNINDYSSYGIMYLEFMDKYQVVRDNNTYNCLLLNDELRISQGIDETIYTEEPPEYEKEYKTQDTNIDDVSARVDKANKEIVLKVDSNGRLVTAQLKVDADSGSSFVVDADDISLNGKNIDLTGDNITISSTYFNVDAQGNLTATSGTFGGNINTSSDITIGNNLYVGQDQSSSGSGAKFIYFTDKMWIRRMYMTGGGEILSLACLDDNGNVKSSIAMTNTTTNVAISSIDCGQATTNGYNDTWINFNKTFSSAPNVVCTAVTQSANTNQYVMNVWGVTTTGFYVFQSSGLNRNVTFNWIAIQ